MSNKIEKIQIAFTPEEASQLIKIINIAVKQVGLEDGGETANNGVYFLNKLNQSFNNAANFETAVKMNGNVESK